MGTLACPQCGGKELLPLSSERYRCRSCQAAFREEPPPALISTGRLLALMAARSPGARRKRMAFAGVSLALALAAAGVALGVLYRQP